MSVINTRGFCRFWAVSWTITHIFGVPKRFPWMSNPKVRLRIGHQQSQFRPIPARFLDYNSVLGSRSDFHDRRTSVCLCVGYQHSPFCPILVRLVDYYSPFWGPRAISTIHDPGGAFTCPSSTLIVLANSDPFRGLSLTFLGSRSDFHSC